VPDAARLLVRDEDRLLDVAGTGTSHVVSASPFAERGRFVVAGVGAGRATALTLRIGRTGGDVRTVRVAIDASGDGSPLAAAAWAGLCIAALEGDPIANRDAIVDLGKRFGIVTRDTSLIVLDRVEDYVRHDIAPPPELLVAFERLRAAQAARNERDAKAQLERVVAMLREKEAWWSRDFPKDAAPPAVASREARPGATMQERRAQRSDLPAATPVPSTPASEASADRAAGRAVAKSARREAADAQAIVVRLKRWTPDAPYIAKLRQAPPETLYDAYLAERAQYASSSAFFLDAADELFERGQRALAVRVLSNLAELDLGNRHLLRILGARLMQAGEVAAALPVLRRVLELAPDEPQSWRDLGLAYAADGQCQPAVDALHEVVRRPWHGRFPGVELIALGELNAVAVKCARKVSTAGIDPRLLVNLPVDLRVVLTWDADDTDIDLWVTDPDGERAYYGHRLTRQGGRMSPDFTGGYGPEEFLLKRAKPGRYRVEAHFYGHRQQIVAGATTLQVGFQTRFGTPAMHERAITLRLAGRGRQVFVGEFDVDLPH
jgi:Flp pilus assembly protein TadD